jgi:hypothetical protein
MKWFLLDKSVANRVCESGCAYFVVSEERERERERENQAVTHICRKKILRKNKKTHSHNRTALYFCIKAKKHCEKFRNTPKLFFCKTGMFGESRNSLFYHSFKGNYKYILYKLLKHEENFIIFADFSLPYCCLQR